MTTSEAAEALGIDRSLVLRFIREKRLQAERHGRDWWIAQEALETFKALPRPMGWRKGRKRKLD
jgi:excisionase family DNA binding protein